MLYRRKKLCLIAAPKTEHYFLSFFIHLLFISRELRCKFHFVSPRFAVHFCSYNDFFFFAVFISSLKLFTNKFKNDKEQTRRRWGRGWVSSGNVIQMSYYFIQFATRKGGRQEEKWNGKDGGKITISAILIINLHKMVNLMTISVLLHNSDTQSSLRLSIVHLTLSRNIIITIVDVFFFLFALCFLSMPDKIWEFSYAGDPVLFFTFITSNNV